MEKALAQRVNGPDISFPGTRHRRADERTQAEGAGQGEGAQAKRRKRPANVVLSMLKGLRIPFQRKRNATCDSSAVYPLSLARLS